MCQIGCVYHSALATHDKGRKPKEDREYSLGIMYILLTSCNPKHFYGSVYARNTYIYH